MAVVSYKDTMSRLLKSPMHKTFTFLGLTLISVLIFLMGAIKPTLATISQLNKEIKIRTEVNSDLQTKINNIETLQSVYLEKKEDLSVIDTFFPVDSDYSILMASLESVTAKYGFEMNSLHISVDTGASASASGYKNMERVDIRLATVGRRANLIRLIEHLEGLPVIPNVSRVTFSPVEDKSDASFVSVTIEMYVYKMT